MLRRLLRPQTIGRCHAAVALNHNGSVVNDHYLPGAKSLLRQKQVSLRNVISCSESPTGRLLPTHSYRWVPMGKVGHQTRATLSMGSTDTLHIKPSGRKNRIGLRWGNCHGKVTSYGQSKTAIWLKRHRRQADA